MAFLARYRVPQTRASYGLSLRQWFRWCGENGIDPLEATRAQIEMFARSSRSPAGSWPQSPASSTRWPGSIGTP